MTVAQANPTRERLVTWDDPKALAQAGGAMDGLAFLTAMMTGNLPAPPVMRLIGISLTRVEDGQVEMQLDPHESQYNPIGSVHGGVIATLLDSVMGCAVHSKLPVGRGYTTLEIKVNYLRGTRDDTGLMRAVGRVLHIGRQTAMAEGSLLDAQGKLYAQATTTCLIFDMPTRTS